jgi:hypothetical protein
VRDLQVETTVGVGSAGRQQDSAVVMLMQARAWMKELSRDATDRRGQAVNHQRGGITFAGADRAAR